MKIAMIGGIGHQGYALGGLKELPDCDLVAVAKDDPDEDLSTFLGGVETLLGKRPALYDDWRRMLDEVSPDVVSVAPVFRLHQPISVECLKRGIHVFCEKPVAMTLDSLAELEKAHSASNARFAGMHGMRYQPNFRVLKTALDEGMIGRPVLINSQKSYYFTTDRPEFYKRRELYGGTLCWVASHALDWMYWFLGPVKSLNAYHTRLCNRGYGECESSGVISLKFASGAVGSVNFDFLKAAKDDKPRDLCRVAGDTGVLEAKEGKACVVTHDRGLRELPLPPEESFFKGFVDSVRGDGDCLVSAEDTFAVTRLCLLARDSADDEGARIIV